MTSKLTKHLNIAWLVDSKYHSSFTFLFYKLDEYTVYCLPSTVYIVNCTGFQVDIWVKGMRMDIMQNCVNFFSMLEPKYTN